MNRPFNNRWPWALYLMLALGYFFSGQLLSGISTQSQVVAIWAPAGFALVGCYLWWWRFFPAVFIASAMFNFSAHGGVEFADLLSNLGAEVCIIAFGATLQAAVGSALLRYWLGDPLGLTTDKQTVSFVFIVGIVVNLISANIGVFALSCFNSSYSVDNHWINVFYWWLGDSLGVLLIAPFLLSLIDLQTRTEQGGRTPLTVLATTSVLFVSVTLTTLFFSQNSFENATALAKREIKVVENNLHRQLNSSLLHIQTLASFIQNTPQINREQFDTYVAKLIRHQPGIKAMSWNPLIQSKDTDTFEQQLSDIYHKPMYIKGIPLLDDDPLVVVKFISPELGNQAAIGFNVYSNPKRKSVLSNQKLHHQPMATPIIQLVQSEKSEPGYLLFAPVYGLKPHLTPEPASYEQNNDVHKMQLLGYATGVFLVQQMIERAFNPVRSDMFFFELYEAGQKNVFSANTGQSELSLDNDPTLVSLSFDLVGQIWQMNLTINNEFLSHYQSRLGVMLFILQLVLVSFIMLLILFMNNRQRVLDTKVSDRTKDLELAKQQSDDASVAKSRFLANMSHEIRTPLNAVIGFSQLAKQAESDIQIKSYINKIEQSSNTLLGIVNDILDISKIESEKLTLEHINFDFHALLKRIEVMFEANADKKQLKWQVIDDLPKDLWYLGDPVRIEQVLMNLCGNAFKFTHDGEIIVHVTLVANKNGVAALNLIVKDSGIGIGHEAQASLFDAFTQADTSTSRRFGGTGLGLAISRELSQLMGGKISLKSELNQGAEFSWQLSLEATKQAPTVTQPIIAVESLAGLRVLVAEDNMINQMVIEELLKTIGITPVLVNNGAEAIKAVQAQAFDLVLMDCQMPVLDGYEATQQIRQLNDFQQLPIIALTADAMPQNKQRAFEVGFSAHLTKPIDVNKLTECLQQYRG